MANQDAGKKISPAKNKPLVIPEELTHRFEQDSELQKQFETFSLSKKREFADHISEAKRAETREKRLEKIIPMIREGIGLHDKYRKS